DRVRVPGRPVPPQADYLRQAAHGCRRQVRGAGAVGRRGGGRPRGFARRWPGPRRQGREPMTTRPGRLLLALSFATLGAVSAAQTYTNPVIAPVAADPSLIRA